MKGATQRPWRSAIESQTCFEHSLSSRYVSLWFVDKIFSNLYVYPYFTLISIFFTCKIFQLGQTLVRVYLIRDDCNNFAVCCCNCIESKRS